MWNSSMPTDPEAGSNPDQTSSDGSGPQSATSQGAGTDSPPSATTHCPCSSASVTSETVMEEPPDLARTRLGVGERVRVSYSLGSATWTMAGKGSLSSDSGATVTYTAPKKAGSVTLTVVVRQSPLPSSSQMLSICSRNTQTCIELNTPKTILILACILIFFWHRLMSISIRCSIWNSKLARRQRVCTLALMARGMARTQKDCLLRPMCRVAWGRG